MHLVQGLAAFVTVFVRDGDPATFVSFSALMEIYCTRQTQTSRPKHPCRVPRQSVIPRYIDEREGRGKKEKTKEEEGRRGNDNRKIRK